MRRALSQLGMAGILRMHGRIHLDDRVSCVWDRCRSRLTADYRRGKQTWWLDAEDRLHALI